MVKYLIAAGVFGVVGFALPMIVRKRENTNWSVFLLRKIIPACCLGLAIGCVCWAVALWFRKLYI